MQANEVLERCKSHIEFNENMFSSEIMFFQKCSGLLNKLDDYIGRTSGNKNDGNSWILYWLGITSQRPNNKFSLIKIQSARVSIPDCDLDFPTNRRKEIMQYIISKYGEEYVAQVVTFGKMKARMSIRDVARAMGLSQKEGDSIAKTILATPGKPITIENSLDPSSEYFSKEFKDIYENGFDDGKNNN